MTVRQDPIHVEIVKNLTGNPQDNQPISYTSPLPTVLSEPTSGRVQEFDSIFKITIVIDTGHHEIHEGDHYMYSDQVDLPNMGTQGYLITTPNTTKWSHFLWKVSGAIGARVELFEGTAKTGTTLQTTYNNNRNSPNVAGTIIHKGVSGSVGVGDGTLIHISGFGSGSAGGESGETTRDTEVILKQNTKYIFRVTNRGTNSNKVNIHFDWYEHTSG